MKPYYEESGIVIYNTDCREVLPHLPRVDLVLTDPPYGIGFAAQPTKWQRLAGKRPETWDNAAVDFLPLVLAAGREQIIWGGNYYPLPPTRGLLSWFKPDAPPSMGSFELAWTSRDANPRQISQSISATNAERVGHPTQKPLAVMLWCLRQFPGTSTVVDPFGGSGTTAVACKQLGIACTLIEIEERYCAIAVERLRQEMLFAPPIPEPQPEQGDMFHRMSDAELAVLGEQDHCREMALERAALQDEAAG